MDTTHPPPPPTAATATDYTTWTTPSLISRIQSLEQSLAEAQSLRPITKLQRSRKPPRIFDSTRYTTRLIALKFAYIGQPYGGYEYHGNDTKLPTIEEVLFSALLKARLVAAAPNAEDPESPAAWPGDEVAEYSKCGRTDRGVSAFCQVVGVRVRSNRPPGVEEWNDTAEIPYTQILNRLLPDTIQILAWAPNPPVEFSARFHCRGRHYRYFFTNPMLSPLPSPLSSSSSPLDISAMQRAAAYFVGLHDFRNFCKLDASKQIENFERQIIHASIERFDTHNTYYFDLRGSAFLWHQVRHMMAVLFLVGQRLEQPEIVRDMLDLNVFPTKPVYEMADDRPLVLWNCLFPDLRWLPTDDGEPGGALVETTWAGWHKKKIDEVLAGELVRIVQGQLQPDAAATDVDVERKVRLSSVAQKKKKREREGHVLILGTGEALQRGKYVPVAQRQRMRPIGEINKSYLDRKGDWRERRELKRKKDAGENEEEVEVMI